MVAQLFFFFFKSLIISQIKYCCAVNKLSLDWGKDEVQYPGFC